MKLIDMTGEQYGDLTVLERDKSKTGTYWICKCKCGEILSARRDQLTRTKNPKKSCTKCFLERSKNSKIKDETGNKYGYLTVLNKVQNNEKKGAIWHCKCDCGNECNARGIDLRSGKIQSCGLKDMKVIMVLMK